MEFADKILHGEKPSNAKKRNISQILEKIMANFKSQRSSVPEIPASQPQPAVESVSTANTSTEPSEVQMSSKAQRQENPSSPSVRAVERTDLKLGWRPDYKWKVGAGMQNQGNSCFMNATIQCLLHSPAFHDWLRFGDINHQNSSCGDSDNKCIICIFHQTALCAQQNTIITPEEMFRWLVKIPGHKFVMGEQEDAYLYLCGLITAMDTAYKSRVENVDLSTTDTPLYQLFRGNLKNELFCAACEQTRSRFEIFGELILDIKDMRSMEAAIYQNFQNRPISDYKCELCACTDARSTVRSQINELPLLLRVQLRRFVKTVVPTTSNEPVIIVDEKITSLIEPPIQIDLSDYCLPETASAYSCTYRLVAAAIHHNGVTADTGHYTSIGCAPSSNGADIDFYLFDDGMPPIPIQKDLVPPYVAENGYFYIYELLKTAKKEKEEAAAAPKAAAAGEVKHLQRKNYYNNIDKTN